MNEKIEITPHAIERMAERKVTLEMVEHALRHGRRVRQPFGNRIEFSAKWRKGRVHVIVNSAEDAVITVYYYGFPPKAGEHKRRKILDREFQGNAYC